MDEFKNTEPTIKQVLYKLSSLCDQFSMSNQNKLVTDWLDTQEACFILKVSKRLIYDLRKKGLLKYCKIGGKIYFKTKDIENFLKWHYEHGIQQKKENQ
jgi:excisionase family DNA binding protein